MKFLDVFNEIQKGNYALTDEAIYSSIQNRDEMVSLYGGNKAHIITERKVSVSAKTKKGTNIKIFSGEGIIISLDGSAGSMTYKNGEKFALNHHAGFITVRDDANGKVCLEYFALFFQNFYRSIAISEGSKTLSLDQIYMEDIELPSYEIQTKILKSLSEIYKKLICLNKIKKKYIEVIDKEIVFNYSEYQEKNISISKHIDYVSGNSGLTAEFIYQSLQLTGEKYTILSSATEERTMMGEIPFCSIGKNKLKVFDRNSGLLVIRNGKAGKTKYLKGGKYTINDHAYILFNKEDSPLKINLKWLSIQYKSAFLEYASSSDNGTWNMTGFFKHTKIDVPEIHEQLRVVAMYERIEQRVDAIQNFENRFLKLLSKEIYIV